MAINPVQIVQGGTPDLVGQFLRGRQFKQESERSNRLLALQEQQAGANVQAQESERQSRMQQAETQFFGRFGEVLARTPEDQRQQVFDQGRAIATAQGLDVSDFPEQFTPDTLGFIQNQAQLQGFQPSAPAKPVALGAKERLVDPTTGREIVSAIEGEQVKQAPEALVRGLPQDVKAKALEAFKLAGGGKEGVKAVERTIEVGRKQTLRSEVPQILDASFPRASPAERAQLEATVQAGKTVESGLKQAEKIRAEQRRLKKAQGFQEKAITLIDNILTNPQLDDVIGSIEGDPESFFGVTLRSDEEANVIADIEEAESILTAGNMSLMTGVLSESDIKLLKNLSGGALNRKRSEKRFKSDLTTMRDKLKKKIVQTIDDTTETPPTPPGITALTDDELLEF